MAEPLFERVAILGVGLIGGSLGLALRARGLAGEVVAYSRTPATRDRAVARGAADRAADSPADCVDGADLVYLATPVDAIAPTLAQVQPRLRPGCLVTDAGSTKTRLLAQVAALELTDAVFVGGHPMAGSASTGVDAARGDLFEGMAYVLTPEPTTPAAALERIAALAAGLGSRVLIMTPADHDRAVAAISHVPHLAAWALVSLTDARAQAGEPVYDITAGSWADATRVAAGDAALWREILVSNREAVLAAVDDYAAELGALRELLAAGDDAALERRLAELRRSKLAHPGRGRRGAEL